MRPLLTEIVDWALKAGEILHKGSQEGFQVKHKSEIDLVTNIDHLSEEYILGQIRASYPQHKIVTEESGTFEGEGQGCWHIDPLDGTVNFAHGIPIFSVSLAYAENSTVLMGVVYDPMRDECFSAEKGKGAWLNGKPIHVSTNDQLINSLLVTGFPYDKGVSTEDNFDNFLHLNKKTQGVRRLGSAALDLCYIAAGRMEGYWELKMSPWDIAAGTLIVEEAGGVVTSLEGSPDYFMPPYSVIAANPPISRLILKELAAVSHRSPQ